MTRRDQEARSAKRKQIWMSIFLAVIMITSVFAVIIGAPSYDYEFGKYKFKQKDGYFATKIAGTEVLFYNLPGSVAYLNFSNATRDRLKAASFVFTTFNPNTANESINAIEIARYDFSQLLNGKIVFPAVEEESPAYPGLPVMTCENATATTPMIILRVADVASIEDAGNCIYLSGRGFDFLRMRDRIIYSYYGILGE